MAEKIELKNIVCRHNIPIRTGYGGSTIHIIIFFDPRDKETYWWRCTSYGYAWKEGEVYSIKARYEGNQRLSYVDSFKSEQKDDVASKKINALDILLPDMDLTNDEKCDIIGLRKEAK